MRSKLTKIIKTNNSGIPAKISSAFNQLKSLVVSETTNMSIQKALHEGRTELVTGLINSEINAISEAKSILWKDLATESDYVKRSEIKTRIRELNGDINELSVLGGSFNVLSTESNENIEDRSARESESPKDSWYSRFFDQARKVDEDWRQNLLSRAFANYVKSPGSISLECIWKIAFIPREIFESFESVISISYDLSIKDIHDCKGILGDSNSQNNTKIETGPSEGSLYGSAVYQSNIESLAVETGSIIPIEKGNLFSLKYGESEYTFEVMNSNYWFKCMTLSRVGEELAKLCTVKATDYGVEQFRLYINGLKNDLNISEIINRNITS